jgi:hypothetical protein
VKRIQEITEVVSWMADSALANKSVYRDQALGDRINCQEKALKSHGTEERRTIRGYETLSSDFVAVQSQQRLCHRPNVPLPASNHDALRPGRFKFKAFRQRSGYYGKGSASIYKQLNFLATPCRAGQTPLYVKQSHLRYLFENKFHCNSTQEQRNSRALAARKTRRSA